MTYLVRSAKSGSDWMSNELRAYNIVIHRQSSHSFFGYTPNTMPGGIDPDFLTATIPPNENLSDSTYRLLQYLDLATRANSGQEPAIHDFAKELLRLLGFEERGTLLRSRYPIPFTICGDDRRSAQIDLCLVQGSTTILLVIQEDKTFVSDKSPEPQVIAKAIAAFQYNNLVRESIGLDPLDSMTIPAITIIGTRPVFYKIPVTQQLSNAVATANYTSKTEVAKCIIAPHSHHLSEGMEVPEFRQEVLQHYEAFRRMSKECWAQFSV